MPDNKDSISDWRPSGGLGQDAGMSEWVKDQIRRAVRSSDVANIQRINVFASDNSNKLDTWINVSGLVPISFIDPSSVSPLDYYAFIPTATAGGYTVDYIYIRNIKNDGTWDGAYKPINPDDSTGIIVYDVDSKVFYRWGGTDWVVKQDYDFPMTRVSFVGTYTDAFNVTTGLTGPYKYSMSSATIASLKGKLISTGVGTGEMYCGKLGGAFIPAMTTWAIEGRVDECDTLYEGAGIAVTSGNFANNTRFVGQSGRYIMWFLYQTASPIYKVVATGLSDTTVAKKPIAGQELYLRIEHTYTAPNHSFTYKYKWTGDGSWTTKGTTSVPESTIHWTGEYLDAGPWSYSMNGITEVTNMDYFSAEYTPDVVTASPHAFIPTVSFGVYTQNYIYKQGDDNTYVEYVPVAGQVVVCNGELWQWSGTAWGLLALSHSGLSNIGPNDHHTQQHSITGTSDHTSTATSGQMLKADANGLPVDATNTDADVASAVSLKHAQSHAADSASDHTIGSLTTGKLAKIGDGTPPFEDSTNTDAEIAGAVSATHARSHALNSTSDHTMTAVEDNFFSADASGLPKDSGSAAASFETAGTCLLLDGTRAMTGNITMPEDGTIGVAAANIQFDGTGTQLLLNSTLNLGTHAISGVTTLGMNDDLTITADSKSLILGASGDAKAYYDGTNLVINPKVAGAGYLDIAGSVHINGHLSMVNTATSTRVIRQDNVVTFGVEGGTGTLVLKLTDNTVKQGMMRTLIHMASYTGSDSATYDINSYMCNTAYYYNDARLIGWSPSALVQSSDIRRGRTPDGYPCLMIGTTTTAWGPRLLVAVDVMYDYIRFGDLSNKFSISLVTNESGYSAIGTIPEHAYDNSLPRYDTSTSAHRYQQVAGFGGGAFTGTIKIRFPASYQNNADFSMEVRGYTGNATGPWTFVIGGRASSTAFSSTRCWARVHGNPPDITVRLGNDGAGYCCVLIGTTSTSYAGWMYASVDVFQPNFSAGGWRTSGWTMSVITSEVGYVIDATPVPVRFGQGVTGITDLQMFDGATNAFEIKPDTTYDQLLLGLTSNIGNQLVVTSIANIANDHDHVTQTNPTLYIHSATSPDSDNTQWLSLTHDQTDGYIAAGKGNIKLGNALDLNTHAISGVTTLGMTDDLAILADDKSLILGAGADAKIYYDGTNLVINSKVVGTGYLSLLGDMIASGNVRGASLTADDGATGSFTTVDGKTVTVTSGIITAIV